MLFTLVELTIFYTLCSVSITCVVTYNQSIVRSCIFQLSTSAEISTSSYRMIEVALAALAWISETREYGWCREVEFARKREAESRITSKGAVQSEGFQDGGAAVARCGSGVGVVPLNEEEEDETGEIRYGRLLVDYITHGYTFCTC